MYLSNAMNLPTNVLESWMVIRIRKLMSACIEKEHGRISRVESRHPPGGRMH